MHVHLMPSRYHGLQQAVAGLRDTGVPLIAFDGKLMKPAGFGDDIGAFYFVPIIANACHLSVSQAIDLFFWGVILASAISGMIGSVFLFRTWTTRLLAWTALLLLATVSLLLGDIYSLTAAVPMAIVPLLLYFVKARKTGIAFAAFVGVSGVIVSSSTYVRSDAGLPTLAFLVISVLLLVQAPGRGKVALLVCLALGVLVPRFWFAQLVKQREAYLRAHNPRYAGFRPRHPTWDSVYIGFGFLTNPYVPAYKDEIAIQRVASVSPTADYCSPEYERILRDTVLDLVRKHPVFVLGTIATKVGLMLVYLLVCCNVGLVAAFRYPIPRGLLAAFGCALVLSSLPGVLVIPYPRYILGFLGFSVLYGVVSLNHALERRAWMPRVRLATLERMPS